MDRVDSMENTYNNVADIYIYIYIYMYIYIGGSKHGGTPIAG